MDINTLLLETGASLLLETGDSLLLEIQPVVTDGFYLLETGASLLLETGGHIAMEQYVSPVQFFLGLGMRKKLGRPEWDDPLNVYGIYQMRLTKRGKVPVKMKFYTPTNPQTVAQQANRQKFADAMAAWQALTPTQKNDYSVRAKRRGMFGWGLFIRQYYQQN